MRHRPQGRMARIEPRKLNHPEGARPSLQVQGVTASPLRSDWISNHEVGLFSNCQRKQAKNFCEYLRKHQHRIVNYEYYQAEELYSIGSGAVESAIKQIGRRVHLSGAQWNRENVPQVLAHCCAYVNGLISLPLHSD